MTGSDKRPIEWHENGLRNMRASALKDQKDIDWRVEELKRTTADIKFLQMQIDSAKAIGRLYFDADRYKKPKKAVEK